MSNRGMLQKQLSIILADARRQGFKIEDIIPSELQEHFQEIAELNTAREYIKELEGHEDSLKADISSLLLKLKAKEAAIKNQPEDYKALKVDLQQAQRSIDFYKKIADDMTERMKRNECKMSQALARQTTADNVIVNFQRLQTELHDRQIAYQDLAQEKEFADQQLAALISQMEQMEADNNDISDAHASLIDTLEFDHASVSAVVNDKTLLLRKTDTIYSAIQSEISPLNKFFESTVSILNIYKILFHSLSGPDAVVTIGLPKQLDKLLRTAAEDLESYEVVHKSLEAGGVAQEQVRENLDSLAAHAGHIHVCLDTIRDDVISSLGRLQVRPKSITCATPGIVGKMRSFSSRSLR